MTLANIVVDCLQDRLSGREIVLFFPVAAACWSEKAFDKYGHYWHDYRQHLTVPTATPTQRQKCTKHR